MRKILFLLFAILLQTAVAVVDPEEKPSGEEELIVVSFVPHRHIYIWIIALQIEKVDRRILYVLANV